MQCIIVNVIEERKAARAAGDGASSTHDEDLLDVLLRLQNDDSLAFPLTTESICAVLFVSIFNKRNFFLLLFVSIFNKRNFFLLVADANNGTNFAYDTR